MLMAFADDLAAACHLEKCRLTVFKVRVFVPFSQAQPASPAILPGCLSVRDRRAVSKPPRRIDIRASSRRVPFTPTPATRSCPSAFLHRCHVIPFLFRSTNTPFFMTHYGVSAELAVERRRDLRVVEAPQVPQRVALEFHRPQQRELCRLISHPPLRRAVTDLTDASEWFLARSVVSAGRSACRRPRNPTSQRQ